jgi:glycosyltransferase involved in cell wall biosynthesis
MKISIITVCFNAEKTIEQTIKSVLSQTYANIEYIIVDGKSTDSTLKIVNKYKKQISKIVSEKDKGLYDAMNKGVKLAKGEIIYFLNADDVLIDKNVVSKVMKEFGNNDLVFGDVEFYYPKENKKVKISRNASINDLKNGNMPPHQGSFVKKEFLIKHPFNLKYKSSADFDFFCNLLKEKPKIKKINKIISRMIVGGVSSGAISYKETQSIIKKHFGNYCYYKIKTKHTVFKIIKMIFTLLRINYHKG